MQECLVSETLTSPNAFSFSSFFLIFKSIATMMHCVFILYLIRIYVLTAAQLIFFPFSSSATMVCTKCGKCFAMSTLTCAFCGHVNRAHLRKQKRATPEAEEVAAGSDEKRPKTDAEGSHVPAPETPPQTEMLESQVRS